MTLLKSAAVYGLAMGVYGIASVYLVVTYLPQPLGFLMPAVGLLIPIVLLWPTRFDRDGGGFGRRLVRRLGLVAMAVPAGALASFLTVSAFPGYIAWSDRLHRESLERRGKSAAEIEATIAQHHQEPRYFLADGALITAMPGVVATLVTTGAGAILLRRRPSRP